MKEIQATCPFLQEPRLRGKSARPGPLGLEPGMLPGGGGEGLKEGGLAQEQGRGLAAVKFTVCSQPCGFCLFF